MQNDNLLWNKMASLNRTKLIVDIVAFVIGFLHIVGIIILFAMPVQNNGESTSNTNGTVFMVILNLLFGLLYFAFFVVDIVLIVQLFITLGKVSDASKSEYDKSSTLLIFMILSIFITLIFTIILFFKLKEIVEKTSVISDVNNSDNVETKIIETQENPKNTLL